MCLHICHRTHTPIPPPPQTTLATFDSITKLAVLLNSLKFRTVYMFGTFVKAHRYMSAKRLLYMCVKEVHSS